MDKNRDNPNRPLGKPGQRPAGPGSPAGSQGRPRTGPGRPRPDQAGRPERPPFEKMSGTNRPARRPNGPNPRSHVPGPAHPAKAGQTARVPRPGQANTARPAGPRPNPQARPPRPPRKAKSGKRGLMIVLDILIVGLFLAGMFFYFYPKWINKQQVGLRDKILESLKNNPNKNVSFTIGRDEYKVPGERLEDWGVDGGENFAEEVEIKGGTVQITYIGRLVIAKIGCDTPLSPVADEYHLRFGAGILHESAPLSANGQTVIFGHRFLTKGRDFNRLDEVDQGDSFYIDIAEENLRYIYRVDKQMIVPVDNYAQYIWVPNNVAPGYSPEDNTLLLVTCHPAIYNAQNERLLIYSHLEKTEPIK